MLISVETLHIYELTRPFCVSTPVAMLRVRLFCVSSHCGKPPCPQSQMKNFVALRQLVSKKRKSKTHTGSCHDHVTMAVNSTRSKLSKQIHPSSIKIKHCPRSFTVQFRIQIYEVAQFTTCSNIRSATFTFFATVDCRHVEAASSGAAAHGDPRTMTVRE